MLIITIFLIFSSIFGFIYYENQQAIFEVNLKDLIKSISMYARIFGHLPEDMKKDIPWEKIGISKTFFDSHFKYAPKKEFLNPTLLPVDLKFMMRSTLEIHTHHFAYSTKMCELQQHLFEKMKKNNMYNINEDEPFCLYIKNLQITISKETLAYHANYPLYVAQIDANYYGMPVYNMLSEQFIINMKPYY